MRLDRDNDRTAMNLPQPLHQLIEHLRSSAGVATVYGAPVTAHGKTLIPVARVAYGFGGGFGGEESGGLGGGVAARPVGVVELGPEGARFIVFRDRRTLAVAALGGFILGVLIGRGRR
jgi:uncharacterized spore protein YtfJ